MVNLVKHDLEFILKQIKVAEQHAAGTPLSELVDSPLLPTGLRTVDGSYNNVVPGRETWGASGEEFPRLTNPVWRNENDDEITFGQGSPGQITYTNNDYGSSGAPGMYGLGGGTVVDADPRTISNLIVDQTLDNPAAIYAALLHSGVAADEIMDIIEEISEAHSIVKAINPNQFPGAYASAVAALAELLEENGIEMDGPTVSIPNLAPDEGLSAPYNSWFTLFGQFFDHGLDLVAKGGNGTVYIPLMPDDPLYNPASPHTNFMAVTRASLGADAANVTTPWVDQNQTYTSHPSHQVFLREYALDGDGLPVSTGKLLEGARGLATWADVKAQARDLLGIQLTDKDVGMVPVLRVDPYGEFIRGEKGLPQIFAGLDENGEAIYVEGDIDNPVDPSAIQLPVGTVLLGGIVIGAGDTVSAARTGNAFLDDIAHAAVPVIDSNGNLVADDDSAPGYSGGFDMRGNQTAYDNELLDAHYITGDGRGNENIGLSAVHHIFHSEHNRLVAHVKDVVLASGDLDFINEWLLEDVGAVPAGPEGLAWDGERLFQAARFSTEMQYQHLVFEEFARKIQPDVDVFIVQPDVEINPAIFAEFAHVIYRFGHSMLTETVDRIAADGTRSDMDLFDAFLNPLAFGSDTVDHHTAAGAIVRGMTGQVGNEIDEFVTNVLRNQLVGIPLDLAAINIARGRDTGIPPLNEARAQFMALAGGDTQLRPYESWTDFALNMKNPASIVNFIAAYGTHESITSEDTLAGKRDAAMKIVFGGSGAPADRFAFLNAKGAYANRKGGLDDVDLWMGGLAEKKMPFGGMLGSTFSFVFELQMEKLQDADRFYYLSRTQGLNFLTELENNSLAKMVMNNTDLGETGFAMPADIFSVPDHVFYVDEAKQAMFGHVDPEHDDPFLEAISSLVERDDNYFRYNGADHIVVMGTDDDDHIVAGGGDDTVWGGKGNDRIEAGYGVDRIHGGEGDDIITNAGTDIGETDFLHGDEGNDVIQGGSAHALIFGGAGTDFLMAGKDGAEIRGGAETDFMLGGDGPDALFGGEGDDWIESGGRADYIAGDNGELFFNSTVIGHDVLNGGGGDTDYDADSGDDIMFAGEGIQKFIGMWGHDWVIHKGQQTAANADMNVEIFPTLPLEVIRDRYSQVEGVSGWIHDDVLRGDDRTAEGADGDVAQIADPTPEGNFVHNELDEAGIARIAGLDQIVTEDLLEAGEYWADGSGVIKNIFTGGNILLGGGGSDLIEGRGGNDIIDGDAWLNVRISIRENADGSGDEIATVDSMLGDVTIGGVTKSLPAWMLEGAINPGQLQVVREILYDDSGVDTAFYWDVMANYEVTELDDGWWQVAHVDFDDAAIDPVTGKHRFSDGIDRVRNVEFLQFADGVMDIRPPIPVVPVTITADQNQVENTPANEATVLTANVAALIAVQGLTLGDLSFAWQFSVDSGATWSDIAGATEQTYNAAARPGQLIRVNVSWDGGAQTSVTTALVGTAAANVLPGNPGESLILGLGGADTINGGPANDVLYGGMAGDTINGNNGDDVIWGGAGADNVNGGNGDDVIYGGTGADVIDGGDGEDLIYGGTMNDIISGGADDDEIYGEGGADTIDGGAGDDLIDGGAGNDTLSGGLGNDRIFGGNASDTIVWNAGDGRDFIDGGAGNDGVQIFGDASAEAFGIFDAATAVANGYTDLEAATEIVITRNGVVIAELTNIEQLNINGLGGGDSFTVEGNFTGTNLAYNTITIEGTEGDDTVDISGLDSDHRVVFISNGGNDTVIGEPRPQDQIEADPADPQGDAEAPATAGDQPQQVAGLTATPAGAILGSDVADALFGGDADDAILAHGGRDMVFGGAGNDTILGGGGADMLFGDAGADRIFGEEGDDYVNAGAGNDTVFGGDGDDTIVAEAGDGDDVYYGDAGIDTLDMSAISAAVTADLGSGFMGRGSVSSALTGSDTIWGIENIVTGSGNDVITASAAVNVIDGGAGSNTFRFLSAADANGDTILGFKPGDKIDLGAMDADSLTAGRQSFTLVSDAFSGRGQLMISQEERDGETYTVVEGNTTGGANADFKISVKGSHELNAGDFSF